MLINNTNKVPEIQLQMFDSASQVCLHNTGNASIREPVELDLQGLIRCHERDFLFQSGGIVPEIYIKVKRFIPGWQQYNLVLS